MKRSAGFLFRSAVAGLVLAGGLAIGSEAGAVGRVDREGVYNIGGWFQYGVLGGDSRYALDFADGPGYSFHLRYNTSRHLALALYFDNQTYGAVADSLDNFKATTVHAGVRYFSIPAGDVMRYAEVSIGFYRPEIEYPRGLAGATDGVICFPGEGLLLHAGVGAEIFFTQKLAVEFGLHGYGLSGQGLCRGDIDRGEKNWSVSGQGVIGIDYFLLR